MNKREVWPRQTIHILIPSELEAILRALAEYYGEKFETFVAGLIEEQAKALLGSYNELGQVFSEWLQREHDYSIKEDHPSS